MRPLLLVLLLKIPTLAAPEQQQPSERRWSDVEANGGVWSALAAEGAVPFLLRGSPADGWPALERWTPQYLGEQLSDVPSVRRSADPRLLFFTVDQFSQEFARNEEFWRLVDEEGNRELAASDLALKTFRWKPPHVMHSAVPAAKVMKAVAGRGKPGARRPHVYAAVDLYSSAEAHALLRDVAPLEALGARREDDPARWRANLWLGSANTTATPHYDAYHNIVVQVYGRKRWRIASPHGLRYHNVFPLGHPSARQLQNTTADITATMMKATSASAGETCSHSTDDACGVAAAHTTATHYYDFEVGPGDVLALPAYWLHEVDSLDGAGSISFNTWQASWAQSTVFGSRPELVYDGTTPERTLATERQLRAVLSAVISAVLSDGFVPGLCEEAEAEADGSCTEEGSCCVAEFFQQQLELRWSSLIDLRAERAAYSCEEPWAGWEAEVLPQLQLEEDSGGGGSASSMSIVPSLVAAFRQVTPREALPTVLADWAEALCYSYMATGIGMRDCPFFFHACLAGSQLRS